MTPRISYAHVDLDMDLTCDFIATAYWGQGKSKADIAAAIKASYVVALFDGNDAQIGFARAVSDGVFSAFVFDLFIVERWRGHGFAHRLVEGLLTHPLLREVRGWMLATKDAQELYAKHGFVPAQGSRYMVLARPDAT